MERRLTRVELTELRNSDFCIRTSPDAAIRQLVSKAITTEGQVIDVFTAAGF